MNTEQAIEFFRHALEKDGKSENTIKNYLSDLKVFADFVGVHGGTGVSDAPQSVVEEYTQQIETSELARTTVNRRKQSIKKFYESLQAAGLRQDNPMQGIKPSKIAKQNETKWLERWQVRQIFETIDKMPQSKLNRDRQRAIFSILVNCGLRVQELCNLKMADLDFENGFIEVVGKGGKYRKVPFGRAAQNAVIRWQQHRRMDTPYLFHTERSDQMTTRAVQHMTQKISKELNFKFNVHQLRHTALKKIADTTGKIEIVASVAGHENVNTSRRYIEPSLKEISEAMQRNEYDF